MSVHERPIATIDAVVLTIKEGKLHVLLTKREKAPFENHFSLPGGLVYTNQDVDLEDSISRVILSKTGVKSPYFEQLGTVGNNTRDPRGFSISVSYIFLLPWETVKEAKAGHHVADIKWVEIENAQDIELAFDHNDILSSALERIKNKVNYSSLPVHLLPEKFTKTQLQHIYEIVLGQELDKSAFRKRLKDFDFLEETGEMQKGSHRPAMLYRINKDVVMFASNIKR